ncbi:hypothetical protein FBEOM_4997 [Fusarium beomiforme]|uniref:Uncharacterized protein n=1 Tax=Fusarium beomiforme TaxID=44412 RepID=A0A9P5DXL9_9HYPO|nr:hypothetical protein FBEOM_4997 [Fusarium beomiforme]
MFVLASSYRQMPTCVFFRKFMDAGSDCGEHGDFDFEEGYEALCIDHGDAIMVELPSLRDVGVTMDWFTQQLRIEQEWAKLFLHTLSPICEFGIMFVMRESAPLGCLDKVMSLILVNTFLNGLVEAQITQGNETRLICSPWPRPDRMPNIDRCDCRSPLQCPKANLQEIFAESFDHVFWSRALDVYTFKGQSHANSYFHVQRMYPRKAKLPGVLGCHLVTTQADIAVHPCEIILYGPDDDGTGALKPWTTLKNEQMGSHPASSSDPLRDRGVRWSYYSTHDPAMDQMTMLAQIEHHMDNSQPCWADGVADGHRDDVEWQNQPQYPLLRHPPAILVHTNIGLDPRDTPLNVSFGPSGIPRAPNLGDRLQPARTEVPGQTFQLLLAQSHPVVVQFGMLDPEDETEEDVSLSSEASD